MFHHLHIVMRILLDLISETLPKSVLYVLVESILVGIYSLFICFTLCLCSLCYRNLFIVGFVKHLLGYLFLHKLYCIYGNACTSNNTISIGHTVHNPYILLESIAEGLLYAGIGFILLRKFNIYQTAFFIGFGLHLLFEISGIHKLYCARVCILS